MESKPLTQEEAETFVKLWQKMPGSSVAKVFNISRQRAHQIADALAKAGVPLKNRHSATSIGKRLNIEKLREIAMQEMENKSV